MSDLPGRIWEYNKQLFTYTGLYVVVKYLPISQLSYSGMKFSEDNRAIVAGFLATFVLILSVKAALGSVLLYLQYLNSGTIPQDTRDAINAQAGTADPVQEAVDRENLYSVIRLIVSVVEHVAPPLIGGAIVIDGINDLIAFLTVLVS